MSGKTAVYLIDGYGLIYQSYHAHSKNPMRNTQGENVSAIFSFFQSLFALLSKKRPCYVAVMLDSVGKTFRHENYPAYKQNRPPTPEDLRSQIEHIKQLLDAMRIGQLRMEGYEADDLIATYSRYAQQEQRACYILSRDKDLFQLVNAHVRIIKLEKGSWLEHGEDYVYQKWQVKPEQLHDFLALKGDASDNIPGVAGIGDKKAAQLLQDWGNLQNIYDNLDQIKPPRLQKTLREHRDQAWLSYELVRLAEIPCKTDWEPFRTYPGEFSKAVPLLKNFEQHMLASKLEELESQWLLDERYSESAVESD